MLFIKSNQVLNNAFSKLIKALGENVEWNGMFAVNNNCCILLGRVRSLFMDFGSRRVFSNIIDITVNENEVYEMQEETLLANIINILLYAFGKWGAIKGLRVDKDEKTLNLLFKQTLKPIDIEASFTRLQFRFFDNGMQITYEDVLSKAIQMLTHNEQDTQENNESGTKNDDVNGEDNDENKEDAEHDREYKLGLWHSIKWKNENYSVIKDESEKVEPLKSRIGDNFYKVRYKCPLCGALMHMVVYPAGKEYRLEASPQAIYAARIYTCKQCYRFYTALPQRLIQEGRVVSLGFDGDKRAYEDYKEIVGKKGARTSNCNFNKYESDYNAVTQKQSQSLAQACRKMSDMSLESLLDLQDMIDSGFFLSSGLDEYLGKLDKLIEQRRFKELIEKNKNVNNKSEHENLDGEDQINSTEKLESEHKTSPSKNMDTQNTDISRKVLNNQSKAIVSENTNDKNKKISYEYSDNTDRQITSLDKSSNLKKLKAHTGDLIDITDKNICKDNNKSKFPNNSSDINTVSDYISDYEKESHMQHKKRNIKSNYEWEDRKINQKRHGRTEEELDYLKQNNADKRTQYTQEDNSSNYLSQDKERYKTLHSRHNFNSKDTITENTESKKGRTSRNNSHKREIDDSDKSENNSYKSEKRRYQKRYIEEKEFSKSIETPEKIKGMLSKIFDENIFLKSQELKTLDKKIQESQDFTDIERKNYRKKLQHTIKDEENYELEKEKINDLEQNEISNFIEKNSPKRKNREELFDLFKQVNQMDFDEHNKEPYLKELEEQIYKLDKKRIDKICSNPEELDFDEGVEVYEQIENGDYLPELKSQTLEMIDKKLKNLKIEESELLARKFKKDIEENIDHNERIYFFKDKDDSDENAEIIIENAANTYGDGMGKYEYPIVVCDTSRKNDGSDGFILTPEHIFFEGFINSGRVDVRDISDISYTVGMLKKGIHIHSLKYGKMKLPNSLKSKEFEAFTETLQEFVDYLKEKPQSRSVEYLAKERHKIKCCYRCGYTYEKANVCPRCGMKEKE